MPRLWTTTGLFYIGSLELRRRHTQDLDGMATKFNDIKPPPQKCDLIGLTLTDDISDV